MYTIFGLTQFGSVSLVAKIFFMKLAENDTTVTHQSRVWIDYVGDIWWLIEFL
jgi:hypothetical protein